MPNHSVLIGTILFGLLLTGCTSIKVTEGTTYITKSPYCSVRTSEALPEGVTLDYIGERCEVHIK